MKLKDILVPGSIGTADRLPTRGKEQEEEEEILETWTSTFQVSSLSNWLERSATYGHFQS